MDSVPVLTEPHKYSAAKSLLLSADLGHATTRDLGRGYSAQLCSCFVPVLSTVLVALTGQRKVAGFVDRTASAGVGHCSTSPFSRQRLVEVGK